MAFAVLLPAGSLYLFWILDFGFWIEKKGWNAFSPRVQILSISLGIRDPSAGSTPTPAPLTAFLFLLLSSLYCR
jgi:hypothetical protein